MKRREWMDLLVILFGFLSFMSLIAFFLAGQDIWHDYASPEVWARAGQNLPGWYSPVNRCPLEWGFMRVGFVLILTFHILLFARRLLGTEVKKTG
jgi:hypothetical protein